MLDGFEVEAADDRLGYVNFSSIAFSSPEWRVNGFVNYNRDKHNARLTARYVSGVTDERGSITPLGVYAGTSTPIDEITKGIDVDAWLSFDATYVYNMNDSLRFTGTVANILDEDPPYTRTEFGYDPRTASPLGRTIELGVKYSF